MNKLFKLICIILMVLVLLGAECSGKAALAQSGSNSDLQITAVAAIPHQLISTIFVQNTDGTDDGVKRLINSMSDSGLDFFNLTAIADKMDDEKFGFYLELLDEAIGLESCSGMSEHALLICRKMSS